MKNIILIGMPSAGKSTIGVILAKTLGMQFVDTDLIIQKREKRLLQDIINTYGIDEFLKIEENSIIALEQNDAIVATGGSVVYSDKAMNFLKNKGTIIYLKISYEQMVRRLHNIKTRGIVLDKKQSLRNIYDERIPLYEKYADIIIDCTNKGVEDIVESIKNTQEN